MFVLISIVLLKWLKLRQCLYCASVVSLLKNISYLIHSCNIGAVPVLILQSAFGVSINIQFVCDVSENLGKNYKPLLGSLGKRLISKVKFTKIDFYLNFNWIRVLSLYLELNFHFIFHISFEIISPPMPSCFPSDTRRNAANELKPI